MSPPLEPHYAGMIASGLPPVPRHPIHVVVDNLRSAYNVGSIFRTSDAGAVERLHLCGMSAHPPHPKIAKTSLGAYAYVPWTYYERTGDALDALRAVAIPLVAVEVTPDAQDLAAFHWPQPVAIIVGNEVTGITGKTLSRCDATVRIPMFGYKNSINVATAFGIVLYHILQTWEVSASDLTRARGLLRG